MTSESYIRIQVEKRVRKILTPIVFGLFMFVVVAPILAFFIQFLWNASITPIFDVGPITFLQAFWLFILAKIFFGFGDHSDRSRKKSRGRISVKASTGEPGFEDDEFQTYWREQGKDAYETFRAKQKADTDDTSEAMT